MPDTVSFEEQMGLLEGLRMPSFTSCKTRSRALKAIPNQFAPEGMH
jgi:hypothetical protein